jgi:hypothetical protein
MCFAAASGVHLARHCNDLIVLDLERDNYLFVLDSERGDDDSGAKLLPTLAQATLLQSAGLVVAKPGQPMLSVRAASRSWQDLAPGSRDLSAADVSRFCLCLIWAVWMVNRKTLAQLVKVQVAAGRRDTTALAREVAVFDALLPWLPVRGECLFRALFLRRFLSSAGLGTDWVFGVHLFPFRAHCWLASGDIVVGDAVHRVMAYEPILTIAAA